MNEEKKWDPCERVTDMMWRVTIKRLTFPQKAGHGLPHCHMGWALRLQSNADCHVGCTERDNLLAALACHRRKKPAQSTHPSFALTIIHQSHAIPFSLSFLILFGIILLNYFKIGKKKKKNHTETFRIGFMDINHHYSPPFHKCTSKFYFGTEFSLFL